MTEDSTFLDGGSSFQLVYFLLRTLSGHLIKPFPKLEMPSGTSRVELRRDCLARRLGPVPVLRTLKGLWKLKRRFVREVLGTP